MKLSDYYCRDSPILSHFKLYFQLTDSTNAKEKASMAKIIFRCFELSGPFKCCQFFSDWTSIGESITWKILRVKKREIKIGERNVAASYYIDTLID